MREVDNDILNKCRSIAKIKLRSAFELDTSFKTEIIGAMLYQDGQLAKMLTGERHLAAKALMRSEGKPYI